MLSTYELSLAQCTSAGARTWPWDVVVVTPKITPYVYTISSVSDRRWGSGQLPVANQDVITILRYGTNEFLGTFTMTSSLSSIDYKPLPNDTIRVLFKADNCTDNYRPDVATSHNVSFSAPVLSTPYKPIVTTTGVITTTSPVVFSWRAVPGAGSYCIRIYSDVNLTNLVTSVCGINQATYTWNHSANARAEQTQVQTYYYQITGKNSVGLGEWSDAARVDVDNTVTTIDATANVESLSTIVPNPNQGNFTLVLHGVEKSEYKILDNAGKVVAAGTLTKGENTFSAGLQAGVYYVVTAQKVQKLVIY